MGIRVSSGSSSRVPSATSGVDVLDTGQVIPSRVLNHDSVSTATGLLLLSYATGDRTETINNVALGTRATAAAATPTLCRVGIFTEAANGDLTLAASIANDTTLFAAANTTYTRALTAPFSKVLGQRFAVGVLVVTATTAPNFNGFQLNSNAFANTLNARSPKVCAVVTGQTDLPSSIPNASIAGNGGLVMFLLG